ncbi:MAG TPA: hypothetical protein VNU75_00805 [Acidimicrobiales bacterium]|nr:hypothetical protein [Acidimicrobiales bacterium]
MAASAFVAGAPAGAATTSGAAPGTHVLDSDTVPVVRHLGPTSFTSPGPFGVGETTLTLPTDGAPVEVWYPATQASIVGQPVATYDVSAWLPPALQKLIPAGFSVTYPSGGVRGIAVAPGRYPLVVFSHGYAGFRDQSTFLTSFLASWGFVVAAPDHYSRDLTEVLGGPTGATAKTTDVDDLEATIALIAHENATAGARSTTTSTPHGWEPSVTPTAASRSRRWRPSTPRLRRSSVLRAQQSDCRATRSKGRTASCRNSPGCSCPAPPTPSCPPQA